MRLLLAFTFCNFFSWLLAQEHRVIKLTPLQADIHAYNFFIDGVIDNRPIRENIGMAQVGMANKQVEAVLEGEFEPTVFKYLSTICLKKSSQKPVVAVFDELAITEKTYQLKERGIASVRITFYLKQDSGLYKIETFEFTEESGGMDVTASQDNRIKIAIRQCLDQLSSNGLQPTSEIFQPMLNWTAVDDEHHILRCKDRKRGIYNDINELRSNSPSVTENFTISNGAQYSTIVGVDGKRTKEPYGFCDGKYIFMNTFFYNPSNKKGLFAQVLVEGRYLLWLDNYVSVGEAAAMGAAFGAIGYAIAKNSGDRDCIILDLKTGTIKPLTRKNMEILLKERPDLLKKYLAAKSDLNVQISIIRELNESNKDF
jgi:hypothetical protein